MCRKPHVLAKHEGGSALGDSPADATELRSHAYSQNADTTDTGTVTTCYKDAKPRELSFLTKP